MNTTITVTLIICLTLIALSLLSKGKGGKQ